MEAPISDEVSLSGRNEYHTFPLVAQGEIILIAQSLSSDCMLQKREEILVKIADAIDRHQEEILEENNADVKKAKETKIDDNLMQRLGMKPQKLKNLTAGIKAIANQSEPIRKVNATVYSAASLYRHIQQPTATCTLYS